MYRIVNRAPEPFATHVHEFVTSTLGVLSVSGIVLVGILSVLEF